MDSGVPFYSLHKRRLGRGQVTFRRNSSCSTYPNYLATQQHEFRAELNPIIQSVWLREQFKCSKEGRLSNDTYSQDRKRCSLAAPFGYIDSAY